MTAPYALSLSQQLGALLSDTSVLLNSFKLPSASPKSAPKTSPASSSSSTGAQEFRPSGFHARTQVREIPECIKSSNVKALNEVFVEAVQMFRNHPELANANARELLTSTHVRPILHSLRTYHSSTISARLPTLISAVKRSGTATTIPPPPKPATPLVAGTASTLPFQQFYRRVMHVPRLESRRYASSYATPFRFVNGRRLSKLEQEANAAPGDPGRQAEFYKELIRAKNPQAVISRFERGKYAQDEECWQHYVAALAQAGQSEKILPRIMQRLEHGGGSGLANGGTGGTAEMGGRPVVTSNMLQALVGGPGKTITVDEAALAGNAGNKGNPIYVVVEEARGYLFWRALRWMGITFTYAFCILTFLSLALENSGLLKTTANQTEYEPSSQQIVKFTDVQGVDEAKQELEEIVEFLKDPHKFTGLGGKLPKGVLLTGPPGTGKTLLARAVAGEAGVPFFFMSGSEFDEMYVGVGARRVRELFAAARRKAPSIVFIDELDAIGSKRNPKDQTYMKQTLNQLLVDLDGFSQTEGVIFIAATNFPELLDKALIRPGRFDRHVAVPLPDVRGRMQIIQHHMKNVHIAKDVEVSVLARGTPGFSGADLANLVNQAAIQASREASREVGMKHMEYAKDKILMGSERRSAVITDESKRVTAYHEGGHALVAYFTPGAMPLHKATIMPRGSALGMTVQLPEMDKDSFTRKEYLAQLDVCMGGRVAEEMIFGEDNVTSGAHNDIMKATDVAKRMVTQYGMNEKLGPVSYQDDEIIQLSMQTKLMIEGEVKGLIQAAEDRAKHILKTHREELHRLAKALIEYETLNQEELKDVIAGRPIKR